jgi:predicted MFS family arabinose efflux permease
VVDKTKGVAEGAWQSWIILTIGFAVLFVSGGCRFALSLTLKPMTEELGWGRALVSLVGMTFMAVSALGQPIVGRLVDRYNPLWIVGAGLLLSSVGIALMGVVSSVWHALLVYGAIYAIGYAATSVTSVGVMVSRAFGERKGVATSVAISGLAVGQLVIIGLVATVLSYLGWRKAFGLLGVVNFLVVLLLAAVFRGLHRRMNALPARTRPLVDLPAIPTADLVAIPQLRYLIIMYAICGLQDFFVSTHVVAFATDRGMNAVLAGNVFALMGLMGLIGVIAAGALADAFGPEFPTILSFVVRVGLFGYIPFVQGETSIIVFALLYGATFLVTAPLTVVFAERAAGPTQMGKVSGLLMMVHQIAGGVGAFLGGGVFDRWGSYNNAFIVMCLLSIAAMGATWLIKTGHQSRLPLD